MARFCLLSVVVTVVAVGFGWLVATVGFGLTGFTAAAVAAIVFLLLLLILTLVSRGLQRSKRARYLRAMSEVDGDGHLIHLEEQTDAIKRVTGVAVGLLVPPQELASLSDDNLVGAVAVSMKLTKLTNDYQTCFAELDPGSLRQAEASLSVARQVDELYLSELAGRGWSESRIRRQAQSMSRMSEIASRRPRPESSSS